jgi:pseudaminic acid synthase
LIKYVAKKNKPIILSGGVADLADIELAIKTILEVNKNIDISLLKCTSEYPANFNDANLVTIKNMIDTFGVRVGVSDHTLGLTVPLISVAFGAKIIEKHFILNKSQGGADAAFSMEPTEFTDMVSRVREAELAIGQVKYSVTNDQKLKRRSLFFIDNLTKDDIITHTNVKSIRPGNGIEPKHLDNIIGMKVTQNIKKGTPVSWDLLKK